MRYFYPEKDFPDDAHPFYSFPAGKADAGNNMLLKYLLSGPS
jgi:hypothetical protein